MHAFAVGFGLLVSEQEGVISEWARCKPLQALYCACKLMESSRVLTKPPSSCSAECWTVRVALFICGVVRFPSRSSTSWSIIPSPEQAWGRTCREQLDRDSMSLFRCLQKPLLTEFRRSFAEDHADFLRPLLPVIGAWREKCADSDGKLLLLLPGDLDADVAYANMCMIGTLRPIQSYRAFEIAISGIS